MRHLSRDEPLTLFPYPDSWHPDDWIDERSFRKNASDALDSDGRAVDYLLLNNKRGRKDEDRVRAMLTLSLSLFSLAALRWCNASPFAAEDKVDRSVPTSDALRGAIGAEDERHEAGPHRSKNRSGKEGLHGGLDRSGPSISNERSDRVVSHPT